MTSESNPKLSIFAQVGLSRSTTGCVSACLFREFQLSASYEGLVETVPGVNQQVLRMDNYEIDKTKDTLFRCGKITLCNSSTCQMCPSLQNVAILTKC